MNNNIMTNHVKRVNKSVVAILIGITLLMTLLTLISGNFLNALPLILVYGLVSGVSTILLVKKNMKIW